VLDAHNVEAQIAERYAQLEPHRLKRRVLRWNWRKMLSFEMRTVAEMDLVLAVSDTDRGTFSSHRVGDRVQVLENGVDLDYFAPRDGEKAGQGVFVGSMDWLPNTEGIRHCIAEVLPLIRRVRPDFELSVVGRNPPSELAALAACDPGLEVTGTVDDVRPYIARAEVYLVPLGFGGGTRLKILEAFAMGKAVVSTTLGCEGIACRHGEHLLIADSPEDFAAAVLRLLAHPELRLQLAANAMGLVQEKYSWDSIGSRLLACYEGLQ